MDDNISLGQWLKQRRKALDLTQEDLAELIGCSGEMVRKIEAGRRRPSRQIAQLLAERLGLAPEERPAFVQFVRAPYAGTGQFAHFPVSVVYEYEPAHPALANLPPQLTAFIGREKEVTSISQLLRRADVRLLTLTGPGGTGKTRIALQVAAELLNDYSDELSFVALAPISDPSLVASAIAQALGVKETPGQPLSESLKDYLKDRLMLLLLDNFEQVISATPMVSELLSAAPKLKVLVTSRATLHIYGEHEFPVPPMTLPNTEHLPSVEHLTQYEAIRLFITRAQAVKPDFALSDENAAAVAEICRRLDGLPLAIELAAARIKLLPPQAILARLEQRLPLLTGGPHDLPARHQTLRGSISWSYDLLNPDEQKLFRRLSVFAGGCTLEAAEEVCDADADLEIDVLDGIASLVDKSLLKQEVTSGDEPRFGMLQTIREYALERFEESGEAEHIRRHHANFFLELAEQAELGLQEVDQVERLEQLEDEHGNMRAALRWSVESGEAEMGLRLAGALSQFWAARGYYTEGQEWLVGGLSKAKAKAKVAGHRDTSDVGVREGMLARAKALFGAANLAYYLQNDETSAHTLAEESLVMFRKLGDKQGIANSLIILGRTASSQDDINSALDFFEESLAISRELGDKLSISLSLDYLGRIALDYGGNYLSARSLHEESLAILRELGHKRGISQSLYNLGHVAGYQGDYTAATSFYEESLAISRELGDKYGIVHVVSSLGNMSTIQGDHAIACTLYEESLAISKELGDKYCIADSLNSLGFAARNQRDYAFAHSLYEESLAISKELGDKYCIARSLRGFGAMAYYEGNYASARTLLEESLAISREFGDKWGMSFSLHYLGLAANIREEYDTARFFYEESLALRRELRYWEMRYLIAQSLEALAGVDVLQGRTEHAVYLCGAAEALREAISAPIPLIDRAVYDRNVATARAQLDEASWEIAWAAGRAMNMEQAVAYALAKA